ncbi:MAG: YbaN family protein [Acidimicrobiia bacterium]|nr:YbaN family protein [Acidimicrobiia bacterium]
MAVAKNPVVRIVLMALGWLWVGIAFVGILVPGIPTTGPIILAAFLFSKSSERFDNWLTSNRYFGSIVRDWRAGTGFTVRAKVIAMIAITVSFGITTWFFLTNAYVRATLWAVAVGVAAFILTRPTKHLVPETADV